MLDRIYNVLKTYRGEYLRRIAMPIGGIGTGSVSLGGRGDLRDWELCNRPAKGFRPGTAFFALWTRNASGATTTRVVEGPLDPVDFEGSSGCNQPHHGLPRFADAEFQSAYPFGRVTLTDSGVPVTVALEAFNPLIPADADASGLPVAVLRYTLTNTSTGDLDVAVCGNLQNFIGSDGVLNDCKDNVVSFRDDGALKGLFFSSQGVDPASPAWGTFALTTDSRGDVTYREHWPQLSWGGGVLDYWDDFSDDGRLDLRGPTGSDTPIGSLATRLTLAAGETADVQFLLTWRFPNRRSWTDADAYVGNYYATQYADAWDAAKQISDRLPNLTERTEKFVSAFLGADLPQSVKEASLYNLSSLRTQTCFRIQDGRFFAWEGCHDHDGCCHGSCTHVWNYEQATAFLFGKLALSMRDTEFNKSSLESGLMSFRVNLPMANAAAFSRAAADGQMGCLMKLYRDWQLSGDDQMLRRTWPRARKALEFCWIPGGWDADKDGVMEGCQHNTMDVEYYGPNPQMGFWYLGALRACQEMANYLGEDEFAGTCRALFENGSRWMDDNLFNGEYYEHEIRPASSRDDVADGLLVGMGGDPTVPILQLGAGCLIDQLTGQYMAHICGLGYLAEPAKIQTTLRSLMKYNYKESLWGHFNHMRSYALQDESAMLMATYPHGNRPERPFPYFSEVMTGFEYTAAVHMIYEDQVDDGLKMIGAVRHRYDGKRRSPFDEAECGHHYGRAMASWAAVLALTGFHYSAVTKELTLAPQAQATTGFWSTGWAWGTFRQEPVGTGRAGQVEIAVLYGSLRIASITLTGVGTRQLDSERLLGAGESVTVMVGGGGGD